MKNIKGGITSSDAALIMYGFNSCPGLHAFQVIPQLTDLNTHPDTYIFIDA